MLKKRKPVPTVRHIGGAMDDNIRDLVYGLNNSGFDTWFSCEGGTKHDKMTGYIVVMEALDEEDLEDIDSIIKMYTDIPYITKISKERNRTWIIFREPLSKKETWKDVLAKAESGEEAWEDLDMWVELLGDE